MVDSGTARNLLLSLIYPITEEDMSADQSVQFALAVDEQAEYSRSFSPIKSESVGDVSVTYESSAQSPLMYYGNPVSPAAIARLVRSGLMRRWV